MSANGAEKASAVEIEDVVTDFDTKKQLAADHEKNGHFPPNAHGAVDLYDGQGHIRLVPTPSSDPNGRFRTIFTRL
jgi:hypothetical protein